MIYQWWRDLFRCRIDLLNFSMGFNIIAPYCIWSFYTWIDILLNDIVGQLYLRYRKIKMQFWYLHFKHPHILHNSDELSRSNFFLQCIWLFHLRRLRGDRLQKKNLTAKVHPKCVKCWGVWNANMRIAFLFADALLIVAESGH